MRAISFIKGQQGSLRVVGSRINTIDAAPQRGDLRIDLRGDRLLPGLINAHDHLQLNALPRLKYRPRYERAGQWIDDISPRLQSEPLLLENAARPRAERLLIGGLKNLLSGVTTVAHHDPLYPALADAERFPVRVLARYGWSHSLGLEGAEKVQASFRATPGNEPWIIHAAEGCDAASAAEFDQLEALGCIAANTVLVHGVALTAAQQHRLLQAGAGLIWCPSSNLHLFERTLDVRHLLSHLALGSDSRISGSLDLLEELRLARELSGLKEGALEALVSTRPAALLRLPDRGCLRPGALADLLVLPAGLPLSRARRADIRLLLIGGRPRYADPDYAQCLDDDEALLPVRVDGRLKYLARDLVAALAASALQEAGLEIAA